MYITYQIAAIYDNVVCGHKLHGARETGRKLWCLLEMMRCDVFAGDFIVQIMITFADFNCCHRKLHW